MIGHLKRFKRGIDELKDLFKAESVQSSVSPYNIQPYVTPSSPSHSISNLSSSSQNLESTTHNEDTPTSDTQNVIHRIKKQEDQNSNSDSGIVLTNRASGNFNKMKHLLEKRMGIPVTGDIDIDDLEEDNEPTPCPTPPLEQSTRKGPPPIPKRAPSTILSNTDIPNDDTTDGPTGNTMFCNKLLCIMLIRIYTSNNFRDFYTRQCTTTSSCN